MPKRTDIKKILLQGSYPIIIALVVLANPTISQANQKQDIEKFLVESNQIIKEHSIDLGEKLKLMKMTSDFEQKKSILTGLESQIKLSIEKIRALAIPENGLRYKEIVCRILDGYSQLAQLHLDVVDLDKKVNPSEITVAFDQKLNEMDKLAKESNQEFNRICNEYSIDCKSIMDEFPGKKKWEGVLSFRFRCLVFLT